MAAESASSASAVLPSATSASARVAASTAGPAAATVADPMTRSAESDAA